MVAIRVFLRVVPCLRLTVRPRPFRMGFGAKAASPIWIGGFAVTEKPFGGHVPVRGWVAVFGASLPQFACVFALLAYGYNLPYAVAEFQVPVTALSLAPAVYGLFYAGLAMPWGMLADRFGCRFVIFMAMLGVGLFLLALGMFAEGPLSFTVLYGAAGVFAAGLGMSVIPKLVAGWFPSHMRGRGILPATVGGGLAGVCSGLVIPDMVLAFGWRGCFRAMGFGIVLLAAAALVLVKDGRLRDAAESGPEAKMAAVVGALGGRSGRRSSVSTILAMPATWIFGIVLILFNVYYTSNTSFEVSALIGAGFAATTVGLFESLNTAATVVGQLLFSPLADRFSRRRVFAAMLLVGGFLYCGLYFVAGLGNEMLLLAYAVVTGLFVAFVPIYQNLSADYYPAGMKGSGPGAVATISLVGRFGGPLLCASVIANSANGMSFAFLAGGALLVGGVVTLFVLPDPKRAAIGVMRGAKHGKRDLKH